MDGGMAHDGKIQREAAERSLVVGARERTEPVMPAPATSTAPDKTGASASLPFPKGGLGAIKPGNRDNPGMGGSTADSAPTGNEARRPAKRRAAGPARPRVAANDDAPSIGGLIFSLQQKPSNKPFQLAAMASGGWFVIGLVLAWATLATGGTMSSPMFVGVMATILLPIALFWF